MILLPMLIWYSRRTDPISIRDVQRCLVVLLLTLFLLPNDPLMTQCQADQGTTPSSDDQARENGNGHQLLREGTRIAPTIGRVVMLGRRWVFIPTQNQEDDGDTVAQREAAVVRAYLVADSKGRGSRLGSKTPATALKRFRTAAAPLSEIGGASPVPFEQVMLQENLMLQRIVESIRADSTDDHWRISGKVTEFLGENRLSIEIAQRANKR